jgi:polysaccharide chain length determinant protein (PEP-CTERM system associated)
MTEDGRMPSLFSLLLKEGKRRLVPLTVVFAVVALVTLGLGLVLPKRWDATTSLLVETDDALKPLIERSGAAVTKASAQTALVSQVVLGRKSLRALALDAGILPVKTTPQQQEDLITQFKGRIKVDTKNDSIVRISYSDTDPHRAARITNLIGKTFIDQSATLRAGESREAFAFIDERVKEYGQKLTDAHKKLLDYYRGESMRAAGGRPAVAAASSTPAAAASTPPSPVPASARLTPEQLASLRVEAANLEAQLGRKSPASLAQDTKNEELARQRVVTAQSELDKLLVTFTDEHPDVRRARRDLAVAKEELKRTEAARVEAEQARAKTAALDDEVARAARARLEEVQAKIAAATGRRPRSVSILARATPDDPEKDPEMRGVGLDTTQSELFRAYDSTREVYQDLLKRRENARVVMDLDAERRGFNMRVQEEAEVPATASSLRLMQIGILGLVLAVLVPIGLLFAIVKLDRRVRTAQQVERLAHVPLLVAIPYEPGNLRSLAGRSTFKAAMLVAGVFVVYGTAFVIKMMST